MALVNYTTEVEAYKTVAEIEVFLLEFGITKIEKEYDDKSRPIALRFAAFLLGQPQSFRLTVKPEAVLSVLRKHKVPNRMLTLDHAFKVGWRLTKDLVKCQLGAVECQQMELAEAFFSFAVDSNNENIFTAFKAHTQKQLGTGETK